MSSSNSRDVVVVGAGIIGIACAHYLQKAGFSVTVIDQSTIASQCSYGNCGYISPSHVLPLAAPGVIPKTLKSIFEPSSAFRIKPHFSLSLVSWFWQFAKRCNQEQMLETGHFLKTLLYSSMEEYKAVISELKLNCEWQEKGLVYVLETQRGLEGMRDKAKLIEDHYGVPSQFISGDALGSFDPSLKPGLAGAFHYKVDASLRPDKLNSQWVDYLQSVGVNFVENCELVRMHKSKSEIAYIETSKGSYRADKYVIAAGAWTAKLAKELDCNIPIQPGKGYSVTTNKPEICPDYPMLFPEHGVGVSPFDEGYRIGSIMEFTGFNSEIPHRRIKQLKASAQRYLLGDTQSLWSKEWQGWRPMTWDSLPIIGRVPKVENAYLSTGHNMLGMSLGAVTGKLIAEMIKGEETHIDATPYSPVRFN